MSLTKSSKQSVKKDRINVCLVSSIGLNIRVFFGGQVAYLQQYGFRFTIITSEPTRDILELPPEAEYISVPLLRMISPFTDLRSLWKLYRIFKKNKFDLVQYTTPKAALLASIASFLARSPVRLYLMWGIYYMGQSGLKRKLFKFLDWLICKMSTHITFDGYGIRNFAIEEGLCNERNSSVVGIGGDNGIDTNHFDPAKWADAGQKVRQEWDIPHDALVIGSVLRLVGDKGINELVEAFEKISSKRSEVYLLLVGYEDPKDHPKPQTVASIANNPKIKYVGLQINVLPYYAAMDIFALPTYREGFSAVNLEAAAMGIPVVTTDAIGAKETIVDGKTGIAVPVKSVEPLAAAFEKLLSDQNLRRAMGAAGRKHIQDNFEQKPFWENLRAHRENLLINHGTFMKVSQKLERISK